MGWKSFAEWTPETYTNHCGTHISEDSHYDKGAALSVCRLLERDGFGGDNESYPVKTWVEEIKD